MKQLHLIAVSFALLSAGIPLHDLFAAEDPAPVAPRRPGPGDEGPGPGPGPRGPRFQPGQFPGGGMWQGRGGGMFESILNEEQRRKFGEEMFAQRERGRELNEKFMTLRQELDAALFGEKLDEELIRAKSRELADVELERSLIRARAFARIRPLLSDDQLNQIKEMRADLGRGPQGGPGPFRGPGNGGRPDGRRPPGPPPGDGDDVLPPPRPPGDPSK